MLKKLLLYFVVVIAVMLVPVVKTDVGKLHPVELVYLYEEEGDYCIETDTGVLGVGSSIAAAVDDLKQTAKGIIYLDTARYLVVTEDTEEEITKIRPYLKGNEYLCRAEGTIAVEEAAVYLAVHLPSVKLKAWNDGVKLDTLVENEGRMHLLRNSQKK